MEATKCASPDDSNTVETVPKNEKHVDNLSRDEVKAQREAKKAAKTAKKNKPGESISKKTKSKSRPPSNCEISKSKTRESVNEKKIDKKERSDSSNNKPLPASEETLKATELPIIVPEKLIVTSIDESVKNLSDLILKDIDPRFRELGLMYSTKNIRGSNHRTIALLKTLKRFVKEYRTPEGKGFKQDISTKIQSCLNELKLYRPFAVGMKSAIEGFNGAIRGLEESLNDEEYKETLELWCDTFIEEKIEKAVEAIAQKGCEKIYNGDSILVFSLTDAIFQLLKLAGEMGKKFKLILVITNNETYIHDYKQLKKTLGAEVFRNNVSVSCVNISSIMSFISSANKVFLGGHALFTTGGVMAHAGSSTIALCASHYNIPTLFFCETYKFCDKSPTDAFYYEVFSENFRFSCDQDANFGKTKPWTDSIDRVDRDAILNSTICYDVTPVNLVTCVVTDIDILPSNSVPVVLRIQEDRKPLTKCL